jgi:hypothetical protein
MLISSVQRVTVCHQKKSSITIYPIYRLTQ